MAFVAQTVTQRRVPLLVGLQEVPAPAVVGVDLDYEVINNMLMVSASGTAVSFDER